MRDSYHDDRARIEGQIAWSVETHHLLETGQVTAPDQSDPPPPADDLLAATADLRPTLTTPVARTGRRTMSHAARRMLHRLLGSVLIQQSEWNAEAAREFDRLRTRVVELESRLAELEIRSDD